MERTLAQESSSEVYDLGLRTFMNNVFFIMSAGLFITALVSQVVVNSSLLSFFVGRTESGHTLSALWWVCALAELGLVLWLSVLARSKLSVATGLIGFGVYAALNGLTIAPVLSLYTGVSVFKVFLITSIAFSACALWGYTSKRSLTGLGAFCMVGLIGLICAMLLNFLFASPAIDFAISCIAVLIFAGLTAYDVQKLRETYDQEGGTFGAVIEGALNLYLDFINLFLHLLRLFGASNE